MSSDSDKFCWGAESWIYTELLDMQTQNNERFYPEGSFSADEDFKNNNVAQVHHFENGAACLIDGRCRIPVIFEFCSQTSSFDGDFRPPSDSVLKTKLYNYHITRYLDAPPKVIARLEEWEYLEQNPTFILNDAIDVNTIPVIQGWLNNCSLSEVDQKYPVDEREEEDYLEAAELLLTEGDNDVFEKSDEISSNETNLSTLLPLEDLIIPDDQFEMIEKQDWGCSSPRSALSHQMAFNTSTHSCSVGNSSLNNCTPSEGEGPIHGLGSSETLFSEADPEFTLGSPELQEIGSDSNFGGSSAPKLVNLSSDDDIYFFYQTSKGKDIPSAEKCVKCRNRVAKVVIDDSSKKSVKERHSKRNNTLPLETLVKQAKSRPVSVVVKDIMKDNTPRLRLPSLMRAESPKSKHSDGRDLCSESSLVFSVDDESCLRNIRDKDSTFDVTSSHGDFQHRTTSHISHPWPGNITQAPALEHSIIPDDQLQALKDQGCCSESLSSGEMASHSRFSSSLQNCSGSQHACDSYNDRHSPELFFSDTDSELTFSSPKLEDEKGAAGIERDNTSKDVNYFYLSSDDDLCLFSQPSQSKARQTAERGVNYKISETCEENMKTMPSKRNEILSLETLVEQAKLRPLYVVVTDILKCGIDRQNISSLNKTDSNSCDDQTLSAEFSLIPCAVELEELDLIDESDKVKILAKNVQSHFKKEKGVHVSTQDPPQTSAQRKSDSCKGDDKESLKPRYNLRLRKVNRPEADFTCSHKVDQYFEAPQICNPCKHQVEIREFNMDYSSNITQEILPVTSLYSNNVQQCENVSAQEISTRDNDVLTNNNKNSNAVTIYEVGKTHQYCFPYVSTKETKSFIVPQSSPGFLPGKNVATDAVGSQDDEEQDTFISSPEAPGILRTPFASMKQHPYKPVPSVTKSSPSQLANGGMIFNNKNISENKSLEKRFYSFGSVSLLSSASKDQSHHTGTSQGFQYKFSEVVDFFSQIMESQGFQYVGESQGFEPHFSNNELEKDGDSSVWSSIPHEKY